jgi:hypothetical protein
LRAASLSTLLGAGGTRTLLLLVAPLWLAFAVLPDLVRGLRRNLPEDIRSRSSKRARQRRLHAASY